MPIREVVFLVRSVEANENPSIYFNSCWMKNHSKICLFPLHLLHLPVQLWTVHSPIQTSVWCLHLQLLFGWSKKCSLFHEAVKLSGFSIIWNNMKQLVLCKIIHDLPTDRATCGKQSSPSQRRNEKGLFPLDISTPEIVHVFCEFQRVCRFSHCTGAQNLCVTVVGTGKVFYQSIGSTFPCAWKFA